MILPAHITRFLHDQEVRFDVISNGVHSQVGGTPEAVRVRTVVLIADGVTVLAMIRDDAPVDLGQLRRLTGAAFVRLASEGETRALDPDLEVGGMAPFGLDWAPPVYIEEAVTAWPKADVRIGTGSVRIRLAMDDLMQLVNPAPTPPPDNGGRSQSALELLDETA